MKLEQQVVSLELAKKLKELGMKQDSHFWWHPDFTLVDIGYDSTNKDRISAFTVAELGEMLPDYLEPGSYFNFSFDKGGRKYDIAYVNTEHAIRGDTEADARAKMLIYLLENKLI